MQAEKPPRESPLDLVPIAPHLRGSAVLKMLHEDNPGHMAAASWQMQSENGVGGDVSSKPLDFMARASRGHIDSGSREFIPTHDDDKGPSKGQRSRANWPVSRRQVCWPPKPEYGEVLAEEDSSNQVPPANQATANRTATNKSTPALLDNHTPVTQVAVNRVAAAPVNQAPPPERPAAVPATTVDSNQEQPCLPPTGAKVPPPIPPRPANYPQVSMEVQQQALQQVNGQMQQQSMMNSSSSSSRQEPSDVGDRPTVANGPTPTVTTQFPAGFKMRDQAPVQQTPPAMILSQPAFKISQPLKKKGDSTWPPKGDNVVTQEQVREFTKPKGGKRDYGEFFAQNALPQTFCSYRAPPGTQHHGEDGTGVSEM